MLKEKNAFKGVIVATSIFGGVQFVKIIISLLRSKAIAFLIGPAGIGISGLFVTALNLITELTSIGLNKSVVQEIAIAKEKKDQEKVSKTIGVLKKLVWLSIFVGCLLMIIFSPLLSEISFDSSEFTYSFIFLSIALLFNQLTRSNLAILQGLRNLKGLSKATVYGNLLGLFITLPLYYFFRIEAIVPAIIIAHAIGFFIALYFTRKVQYLPIKVSLKQAVYSGGNMMKLGAALSLGGIISILGMYLLQVYISNYGGIDEVGFYIAGIVILNTYVGAVFTAMATDYYPQLAAISSNISKIKDKVFEQAYIGVLLLVPIVVIFIAFAPFFIELLYSEEFLSTTKLVSWGILGMIFKMGSFSMGYIIIAKADTKLFVKTIIVFNVLLFSLNIVGYNLYGIEGLGISFLIHFIIHFISLLIITKWRYNFTFKSEFYPIFIVANVICILTLVFSNIDDSTLNLLVMIAMTIISVTFSFIYINKKVDIISFLKDKLRK
ncbi:oligosaccharide flippase family protein [Patiriisocius hiemis]|uniref:Oligosaccharide flippase family protein n=1 Tax=Patiriisocius hiemis TaxID=3075604 RepID=A0ABU2YFR6_9FLAO|nr:oligosaccharide flippase family protein [Constantimarinum sp. W242]MDT0556721.1 oligosaccharide flippase family protein [Constantimarinum sp. W242]